MVRKLPENDTFKFKNFNIKVFFIIYEYSLKRKLYQVSNSDHLLTFELKN